MARRQGSELGDETSDTKGERQPPRETSPRGQGANTGTPPVGIPDGLRRLIALGLSGVFATQENLRQVVGDALPREWVDFVSGQSERTRAEFLERLAGELARSIESIDLARVMQQALEGRTLEVHARIRMLPDEPGGGGLRLSMKEDDES